MILGGPTPENYKQDDDSAKVKASAMAADNSAKNQAGLKMKPSAASANPQDKEPKMEETESESEEEVIQEKHGKKHGGMPQGLKDFLAKKKDKYLVQNEPQRFAIKVNAPSVAFPSLNSNNIFFGVKVKSFSILP